MESYYSREQWKEQKAMLGMLGHIKKHLGREGVRCEVLERWVGVLEARQSMMFEIVMDVGGEHAQQQEKEEQDDEEEQDEGEVICKGEGENDKMADGSDKVFMFRFLKGRKR